MYCGRRCNNDIITYLVQCFTYNYVMELSTTNTLSQTASIISLHRIGAPLTGSPPATGGNGLRPSSGCQGSHHRTSQHSDQLWLCASVQHATPRLHDMWVVRCFVYMWCMYMYMYVGHGLCMWCMDMVYGCSVHSVVYVVVYGCVLWCCVRSL